MHRGKPLYLSQERYAALTHMVCRFMCTFDFLVSHVNITLIVKDAELSTVVLGRVLGW